MLFVYRLKNKKFTNSQNMSGIQKKEKRLKMILLLGHQYMYVPRKIL